MLIYFSTNLVKLKAVWLKTNLEHSLYFRMEGVVEILNGKKVENHGSIDWNKDLLDHVPIGAELKAYSWAK